MGERWSRDDRYWIPQACTFSGVYFQLFLFPSSLLCTCFLSHTHTCIPHHPVLGRPVLEILHFLLSLLQPLGSYYVSFNSCLELWPTRRRWWWIGGGLRGSWVYIPRALFFFLSVNRFINHLSNPEGFQRWFTIPSKHHCPQRAHSL